MFRRLALVAVLAGGALAFGVGRSRAAPAFARRDDLKAVAVADGFDHPLFLCSAPGDARVLVVEQPGTIRWIENGRPSSAAFADLRSLVRYGGERGLLGLAFHPAYATNRFLFVNYTDRNGDTQVV